MSEISAIIQIANDIQKKVSAIEFDDSALVASVDLAPDFDLATIKKRQIVITPQGYSRVNATRGDSASTAKINVCVLDKIALSDAPNSVLLVEKIAKGLEKQALTNSIITAVEFDPIYDAQVLRTMRVFVSVCVVTAKVIR